MITQESTQDMTQEMLQDLDPDSAQAPALTHTQQLMQVPASTTSGASTPNIETGIPGVRFDPESMSQTISDEALADQTMARGNAAEQVVVLLARGDLRAASELVAETRFNEPQNFAMRVLDTSLTRASGDPQRAANRLRALLSEFNGTAHESLLQQHLGMAYVESGDLRAAATRFRKAIDLRTAEGADQRLIEFSRRCLDALLPRLEGLAPHTAEPAN
jgi:hypothetical protein